MGPNVYSSMRARLLKEEQRKREEAERQKQEEAQRNQQYLEHGRGQIDEHPLADRQAEVEGEYSIPNVDRRFYIPEPGDSLGSRENLDSDQLLELYAKEDNAARQQEEDERQQQIAMADAAAREAEERELAELTKKPAMRERILRALAAGAATYASDNPGATAASFLQQYADEQRMVQDRIRGVYERRAAREGQRADKLDDRSFQSKEAERGRMHQSVENARDRRFTTERDATNFDRELTRDELNHGRNLERDQLNHDLELERMQRQFDNQLGLSKVEHKQEIERLRLASGLSREEAAMRVKLESAARREQFLTEQLGVDPVSARQYSQAVESGKWDENTRQIGQTVLEAQRGMVELEKARQRIQALSAAKGLTAPVMDEKGGLALDRNGRPIEAPVGLDEAMSGQMPEYVRKGAAGGRGGRIERAQPKQGQQEADLRELQASIDALVKQHGAEAIEADVSADETLPADVRAAALSYIRQKYPRKRK